MKNVLWLILLLCMACEDLEETNFEDQSGITGRVVTRYKCLEAVDVDTVEEAQALKKSKAYCIRGDLTIVGTDIETFRMPNLVKIYGRLVVVNNRELQDLEFEKLRYVRDELIIIDNPRLCADYIVPNILINATGYSLEALPSGSTVGWNGSCYGYPDI